MSHYDALMTELRALAFTKGAHALAKEGGMHVETLRAILGDKPPKSISLLKKLAEIADQTTTEPAPGAVETVEGQSL